MNRRRTTTLAVALALFAPALPARAGVESWNGFDVRLPLSQGGGLVPGSLQLVTELRYGAQGIDQLSTRVGPLWELTPYLGLGAHVAAYAEQGAGRGFDQEMRLDLEPTFRLRLGAFSWTDRNRLEHRQRQVAGARRESWRYRNQLRLTYAPEGAAWRPYVSEEVVVDLSGGGFNQNRANVGIGRVLSDATRLDVGYGLRSRLEDDGRWSHDHLALVSFSFAPRADAVLAPGCDHGD